MRYKILLFDLDDTLLDFGANETDSLTKLFQQHGYPFSDELFGVYNSVNKQLWADYEDGKLALADVLNSRFSDTMLKLGEVVDGTQWENQYRELLGNGCQMMDGALELCRTQSVSHRLFAVTNGITQTQIKRLKRSGLYEFFEGIFDSQSIGYQKPSKEFFDYVMGHIKDFKKEEALMIGDSLNSDIKGGLLSGIDTCWINGKAQKPSAEIQSTYIITELAELYDIIDLHDTKGKGNHNMESITQQIQQKALELGCEKCGIIPVGMLSGYKEKLDERIQKLPESSVFYQGQQRLVKFEEEFPWAKSVVVLIVPYSQYNIPESVRGHIAKKYLLDTRIDENTKEHRNSIALEQYMRKLGIRTATNRKFGVVGLRWAAMQAGLGIIRRNNFFYTESGSWINIEAFLTDREMELIETPNLPPCSKNCDRCIKACPTASLCEAFTMNPLKCVSYLTTFGGRDLPKEPLAAKFGDWIYGCDVCQDVCPMNHKKWMGSEEFPKLAEVSDALTAENIMEMDEQLYREEVQSKFFYLAPDELWKWQVNALNFMDNIYEEHYHAFIQKACGSSYPKVRDMADTICQRRGLQ